MKLIKTFQMILMMVFNKTVRMDEVFLMTQLWTIWRCGHKDKAFERDNIIHLFSVF